ncbi:MAG: hypothetical protein LBG68_00395 [Coriobacteriales bacterium]|jgi:hypothetical protein|nr:hypothetical protein [Coriobacteriales bacterium]
MQLYEAIYQRKSVRKYDMQALPEELLVEILAQVGDFQELYTDLRFEQRLTNKTKGAFGVKAPHYLIISGSGAAHELEAAGFLYQQLSLWLTTQGLGSIWLGSTKDSLVQNDSDILALAFGKPLESPYRSLSEFNRKPISQISNAPDEECIQAVHLAPSGMNLQPWYLEKTAEAVLLYEKKPKGPSAMVYKLTDLDMGIALSHYALATTQAGRAFNFHRKSDLPDKEGYVGFGIIQ